MLRSCTEKGKMFGLGRLTVIEGMLLLLASAPGAAVPTGLEPPREPLVCRYESVVSRMIARRKLCLTPSEWAKRDQAEGEAARRSIYQLMGSTACLDGGLCTIE
jgi:hypothetical protein